MNRFSRFGLQHMMGGVQHSSSSSSSAPPMEVDQAEWKHHIYPIGDIVEWQQQNSANKHEHTDREPDKHADPKAHKDWEYYKNLAYRNLSEKDLEWLKAQIDHHGLDVTLTMKELEANRDGIDWYSKDPKYWDDEKGSEENKPLLMIDVVPGANFIWLFGRELNEEDKTYNNHISLCFL